jgi:hypothetical protein
MALRTRFRSKDRQMKRPAMLAAACAGFRIPAFAGDDNNHAHMKMLLWEGGYNREARHRSKTGRR